MMEAGAAIYWLETWNAQISTIVGAFAGLCGLFALFASGISCKIAGLLQIATGVMVVAIEGPNFLPQLAFAAPTSAIIEGKPAWFKVALYAALTIVPAFAGCLKAFLLGFLASALITAMHAFLLFGRRPPPTDEMGFQGGLQQQSGPMDGQLNHPPESP